MMFKKWNYDQRTRMIVQYPYGLSNLCTLMAHQTWEMSFMGGLVASLNYTAWFLNLKKDMLLHESLLMHHSHQSGPSPSIEIEISNVEVPSVGLDRINLISLVSNLRKHG